MTTKPRKTTPKTTKAVKAAKPTITPKERTTAASYAKMKQRERAAAELLAERGWACFPPARDLNHPQLRGEWTVDAETVWSALHDLRRPA